MFTNGDLIPVEFHLNDSIEISVSLNEANVDFDASVGTVVIGNADDYKGKYVVIPRPTDQTLLTKDKRLTDNMTVKRVPQHVVPNGFGDTFTIGD